MTGHVWQLCIHDRKEWQLVCSLVLGNCGGGRGCRLGPFTALVVGIILGGGGGVVLLLRGCAVVGNGGFRCCNFIFRRVLVGFVSLKNNEIKLKQMQMNHFHKC